MNIRKLIIIVLALFVILLSREYDYVAPEDSLVKKNLEKWQDLKFGLMMHWGPYSQWGAMPSWTLCNDKWIDRTRGRYQNYYEYKEDYRNLKKTFNPTDFDPDKWARAAENAGMQYLVFTTKHHDGFCMFDTKTTDYKITSNQCPFHAHSRANVTKEIFDSFRELDFMIGAYFSKPDWNSNYYWWQYYDTPDRNVNYDPEKHPERWQNFKDFTYQQIEELMTNYGDVDILWLDGAWVQPAPEKSDRYNQDLDMAKIAKMARQNQPGVIIVDRWVTGKYENYLTPENQVPDQAIEHPWESCMPMAPGWAYNKHHKYKSVHKLVHTLVDVVSKGGNYLLNIAPSPKGDWAPAAYQRLEGLGNWIQVNGEAIYGSEINNPHSEHKIRYTSKNNAVYAIYLADENEDHPPQKIVLYEFQPAKNAKVKMLGCDQNLDWEMNGKGVLVNIPAELVKSPPCQNAWTLKFISESK